MDINSSRSINSQGRNRNTSHVIILFLIYTLSSYSRLNPIYIHPLRREIPKSRSHSRTLPFKPAFSTRLIAARTSPAGSKSFSASTVSSKLLWSPPQSTVLLPTALQPPPTATPCSSSTSPSCTVSFPSRTACTTCSCVIASRVGARNKYFSGGKFNPFVCL